MTRTWQSMEAFEASLADIVRVRIYTTCIDRWE